MGDDKSLMWPEKQYAVIYADPPWCYRDRGCNGAANKHYRTMTFEAICALPVADISSADSALFLWATWPTLPDALRVMEAWGYHYKTAAFCWVKTTKDGLGYAFGPGHWTRANTEPCLLGIRGRPRRVNAGVSQVVAQPRGCHSAKPPEVRDRIVRLMGDIPRVELFARQRCPGWDCWGDELPTLEED